MVSSPVFIAVACVIVSFVLVQWAGLGGTRRQKRVLPDGVIEPPGPKGKPIVGNLLDIPPAHSWLQFKRWADEYGPMFRLNIAGGTHVVVSTEKIANDLMRERGTLYSSREQFPMAAQLLSDNLRPLFLPYGDLWRNGRKLMHHLTMSSAATSYQPVQEEESTRMLRDLIRAPKEYERWFERYAAGLVLRLAFGQTIHTGQEDSVRRILAVVHTVERVASPGAYLVDILPSLMYLPSFLAPFKREAARLHAEELDLFRSQQADVRRRLANHDPTATDTFTAKFLTADPATYNLSDDEAAYVIGTLFEAGAGTTAAALMSFLLAMTLHPKEFAKLQAELDSVVGPDRLPVFTDIDRLPRVRATVKETLRWRPVTAGGVPHLLVKDDVYDLESPPSSGNDNGTSKTKTSYLLRAGTNIHANQWAIHREAALYPDPESFRPERWLDPAWPTYREPLSVYPNLQNFSAFGFGRRICPGQNIAERSLNIAVARVAWGCDVKKVEGWTAGEYDYTTGFNVQPKNFADGFELRARGEGRGELVEREWKAVWGRNLKSG